MSKSVKFGLDNGDHVRDIVSGQEGIVTARCQWLNGCIQPKVKEDGTHFDAW